MLTDSHLTRKTPPSYADGVYMLAGQDRPSPRKLSQIFMKGEDGLGSSRNRTALLAFFGKLYFHKVEECIQTFGKAC
jgi:dual oxidase